MARVLEVKVDVAASEALAERLGQLDGEVLARVATAAVNSTDEFAYDTAKTNILSTMNLTDGYVSRKVRVVPAEPQARPRAVVRTEGTLTTLGHYGAQPLTQPVKNAKRSKGWAAVGVAPGQKQAGVSVEVIKGARKTMAGAFILPGKKDNEGNPLLFFRQKGGGVSSSTGRPKVDSLLGPSVYQLFKKQYGDIMQGVEDNLERTLLDEAEEAMKKVLE